MSEVETSGAREASGCDAGRLALSELFRSLQGEGVDAGKPATFLRLAGCNLRCVWCDTAYTWDWQRHDPRREVTRAPIAEVARRLAELGRDHVVVTGGEPLLQGRPLAACLRELQPGFVEVETNGTLMPVPELLGCVQRWNVSPKLGHAGGERAHRICLESLRAFQALPNAWLKAVVGVPEHFAELDGLLAELGWPTERVCVMGLGQSPDELDACERTIAAGCVERGFRLSPRLHVRLWPGRRGI